MKALLLANDFPPIGGGIARWMEALARRYPAGDLTVSTGLAPDADGFDRTCPSRIDRVAVNNPQLRSFPGRVRWSLRAASVGRATGARLVWCDTIRPTGYVAQWVKRRLGIPLGLFLHGGDIVRIEERSRTSAIKRRLARSLLGSVDLLVANSKWTAGRARSVLAELGLPAWDRVTVVPLGSDPSVFRPGPGLDGVFAERYRLPNGRWLVTVARLVPHKGIDTALDALARLGPEYADVRYLVVGDGPDRDRLERLAVELGVRERVHLVGSVTDDLLPAAYRAADVYLGLSREERAEVEGFGIAMADAAASGIPVVAGRAGGVPETVEDGVTGRLVEPKDAEAAAQAIRHFLSDRRAAASAGLAGRRRVERTLNWDRVVADLVRLTQEVAGGARR